MIEASLLLTLLILSGIFSGLETAVTSLSPFTQVRKGKNKIQFVLNHKEGLIASLLIANNITIVSATLVLENAISHFPIYW
ncbi:MAG: DUF21 domain-containing protein, partial [Candidatus Hydrogenedentota bacterium]